LPKIEEALQKKKKKKDKEITFLLKLIDRKGVDYLIGE